MEETELKPGVDYPDALDDVITWLGMESDDAAERGEDTARYDECLLWLEAMVRYTVGNGEIYPEIKAQAVHDRRQASEQDRA